jgi:hypothetical protein
MPYRRLPVRRLLFECNRRLHGSRGPRGFEMVSALIYRWPQVQSGIVYIGDSCTDAGREHRSDHCCMAQLMKRCGKTAHRAKYDLLRAGLVKLHGAGPGERAGGKILNQKGQAVGAATGYQLDPAVLDAPRPPSTPKAASGYESPAQQRLRADGRRKLADAVERMRAASSRAGP